MTGSSWRTLGGGLLLLVLASWGAGVVVEQIFPMGDAGLDLSLTRHLSTSLADAGWLRTFVRAVTELGGSLITVPIAVALGLAWRWQRGGWTAMRLLAVSLAGSTAAQAIVKRLVARPRPPIPRLAEATGWSFPSGHAARGVALYAVIALLVS